MLLAMRRLHHRQRGPHGRQQLLARSLAAALLRNHQHIRWQTIPLRLHQRRLGPCRQVAGQQHAACRTAHPDHATVLVLTCILGRMGHLLRLQHLDSAISPWQCRTCQAGLESSIHRIVHPQQPRVHGRQQHRWIQHRHCARCATGMVRIQMRHHQNIHPVQPPAVQPRHQGRVDGAAPAKARRPRVVQQAFLALLHHNHAALSNVQCRHHQRIRRRVTGTGQQQRQQAQHAQSRATQPHGCQ